MGIGSRRSYSALQQVCIFTLFGLWCRWFGLCCALLALSRNLALTTLKVRALFDLLFRLRLLCLLVVTHRTLLRPLLFLLSHGPLNLLRLLWSRFRLNLICSYRCIFIKTIVVRTPLSARHPSALLRLFIGLGVVLVLFLLTLLRWHVDRPLALEEFTLWLIILVPVGRWNSFNGRLTVHHKFLLK